MAASANHGGEQQQYCLKWNNHRSTLFSVFDTLLEEESLVDVILSAENQFIKAHRVILSACSPYFRSLFKSHYLQEKQPVIIVKDMEFDNLKSLVEYMYKGEANVPQQMLPAFIKDAESLQIRGLAECATKHQFDLENLASTATSSPISHSRQQPPLSSSTPILSTGHSGGHSERERSVGKKNGSSHDRSNSAKNSVLGPGGILAARLKDMTAQAGGPPMGPLFDFMSNSPESFHSMVARNPGLFGAGGIPGIPPPSGVLPAMPPITSSNKKKRKSAEPRPRGGSPTKDPNNKLKLKSPNVPLPPVVSTNNNYGDLDDDGGGNLKIDEDVDPGKENLENKMDTTDQDSIAVTDLDNSNGVSEEEEEPSMPGPGGENFAEAASEIINPWTGGRLQLSDEVDENSAHDDTGLVWGPNIHLGDFSETAQNSLTPNSTLPPTPASLAASAAAAAAATSRSANSTPAGSGSNTVPRLKRLNNAQQHNVYTLCQTAEGAMKFRCTECSRCFNLKCTLLRHVRHQHQGRFVPHPCGQCGQVFKRTDHLKVHMRKIHKMTSASRSNRGGGGANNSRVSLGPGPEMGNVSADAISVSSQSALVAAAVASMANTQPLALTTKSEESDGERK